MTDLVKLSAHDGILEAVIDRPGKYNALNWEIVCALSQAVERLNADDDLRVLLIRSTGKYFSAGADVNSELFPDPSILSMAKFRRWYRRGKGSMHPLFDEFEASEKPIVVAHHGPCLGGALEMSLSCDFRLAAASATYALPETALGSLPGSGGTSRLTRIIGPHWARWFIMANLPMSADRALTAGLVHDVYPDAEFEAQVRAFCLHLAKQPPETVAAAKLTIEMVADLGRSEARNAERFAVSALVMGEESRALIAEVKERMAKGRK
nr:enoyl-CoA hydratase/isomerase family protein [Mesorhizobium sp.]